MYILITTLWVFNRYGKKNTNNNILVRYKRYAVQAMDGKENWALSHY